MTKTLDKILNKLDGYLMSIERNLDTGMYELKVGFRKNWVYKSTDDVECKVIVESENGNVVTILGKHDEIIIDDLINFVNRVIETNKKITLMQKEFDEQLEKQKQVLIDQQMEFNEQLDEIKETSFDDYEEDVEPIKENTEEKDETDEVFMDEDVVQKIS